MTVLRCLLVCGVLVLGAGAFRAFGQAESSGATDREEIEAWRSEGTVRVTTSGRDEVFGRIIEVDSVRVVVQTEEGLTVHIPRDRIVSIRDADDVRQVDPNRTRLFFAPTGRSLARGEGYLAVYEIFAPFLAVRPFPGTTLAGGITLNPGSGRLAYAAPKVTVLEGGEGALAVGALGFTGVGFGSGSGGLFYVVGTRGTIRSAVTAGLAIGYAEGELGSNPAILLGGERQVADQLKLVTENYWFVGVDQGFLVSGGVRFFGDRLAGDFGLITVPALLDDLAFPFVPWLGLAYNFTW